MLRIILLVPVLATLAGMAPAAAQAPEDEVLAVVNRLFDGMRQADTTVMRSTLHADVRLVTTGERDGEPVAQVVAVERWLDAVAGSTERLDETLHGPEVRIDGNLATVWTFYTLHVGDRFSHCGVDAFQLVRGSVGWKIIQVADTRRPEGCEREGGG